MGYCADGNGEIFLKDGINIKELKTKLDNLNSSIDYNIENKIILIEEYSFSWDEDRTCAFLNTLKPYVEKGLIEYKSIDDDRHWRYVYNPVLNKREEEIAYTSYGFEGYTDNELIDELKKRGYIIRKTNIKNKLHFRYEKIGRWFEKITKQKLIFYLCQKKENII